MNVLAPITQTQDMVNKAYVDKAIADLNISEYAKASELDKKVDKVTGKGLSTNDYTTADKNKLASLENYDDTEVKNDISNNADAIAALKKWYDAVGSKFTKESDGSIKMTGDFFATGELAASNAGTSVADIEHLVTRVEALEQSKSSNVEIKVSALSTYNQQSVTSLAMSQLAGLTVLIANSMLLGTYNKVIDKSGTYPKIWNYSATRTSNIITLFFAYGDGFNSKEGCRLDYHTDTLKWDISIEDL